MSRNPASPVAHPRMINLDRRVADGPGEVHSGLVFGLKNPAAGQHSTETFLNGIFGIGVVLNYLQGEPKPLFPATPQSGSEQAHRRLALLTCIVQDFLAQKLSATLEELKPNPHR